MTREEAIDELSVICERLSHPEDCENGCYSFYDGDYTEALDMAIEALQSEVVMCKDCKYGVQDEDGRWSCYDLGCQMGDDDGNGFCSDGERKEK